MTVPPFLGVNQTVQIPPDSTTKSRGQAWQTGLVSTERRDPEAIKKRDQEEKLLAIIAAAAKGTEEKLGLIAGKPSTVARMQ